MSLSHLRPLTAGEILDGAFVLYRRHFTAFFVTGFVPLLPVTVFWAVASASGGASEGTSLLGSLYSSLVGIPISGALIHLTSRAVTGGEVSVREGWSVGARSFWKMVSAAILAWLAIFLAALALLVPGLVVYALLSLSAHAVVLEGASPGNAVDRSWNLTRPSLWRVLGVLTVAWLIYMGPIVLVGGAAGLVLDEAGDATYEFLATLLIPLSLPFIIAAKTLIYYDCLVRQEGVDLQAAAADLEAAVPA